MRFTTDIEGDELVSNRWGTAFIRFVWPVFFFGSIPGFLLTAHTLTWPELLAGALAMAVLLPAYYCLIARPLRFVWIGAAGLRVSSGRRDIRVPYTQIEQVRGFWYARDLVKVVLKERTSVGRWFIFIPRFRLSLRGDHPVVNRLRERARLDVRADT